VAHEGGQLVPVEDLAPGVELVDEAASPAKPVTDLSGLPIPEDVLECVEMARNGRTWAEIAAHLGTDTRHLIEKVRRIIEVLPPNAAAALKDRTNFERYAPFMYAKRFPLLTPS